MRSHFTDTDYQLRWPRWLFVQEASSLLNRRQLHDWDDRCELLLEDAFVGDASSGPRSEFRDLADEPTADTWSPSYRDSNKLNNKHRFLRDLLQNAEHLHEGPQHRRAYWSQRQHGTPARLARQSATIRQFVALIQELDDRGYFEKSFEKDCVDAPATTDPSAVIEHEIGAPGVWPLQSENLATDLDLFCDVVEVLHDLVARPSRRHLHNYAGCGWHHSHFSIESGRAVYRWRVNQLLDRSDIGLRLAEDGDDIGRMVTAPGDERSELLQAMSSSESEVGDQLRHAISTFRARDADRHTKRSAVVVLCQILEERRQFIKQQLIAKDEQALFQIANNFNLRHQNANQQSSYDEAFLDWLFWWYLATIELTDRITARNAASPSEPGS
ncbi:MULTISPECIES: hypothetical protein [Prauserella salsuginis group]|uniref:DUF4209 domain-containing protein n=1 Tax=Prauserella salsuginis TaxID=387889 RepID=A0ABW6GBN0_9PSEU|nr:MULTISPECIES: hypothetical protein [Prauserella salsuginis group]MCR3721888.1 hypothetical protein [Prauserella flava]MCR3735893.1 hypothetical protein [Prauserella salsuginis]